MSDAPTAPPVPDPTQTAQTQYAANTQSGIANSIIGNPNVTNAYGSVSYAPGDTTNIGGFDIPRYNETQTLSPGQQTLYDQQTRLGAQQNRIAGQALGNVSGILSTPVNTAPGLLTNFNTGGGLTSSVASGPIQDRIAGAGAIGNSIAPAGSIASSYNPGGAITNSYSSGGPITNSYGLGGDITKSFNAGSQPIQQQIGPTDFTADVNNTTAAIQSRLAPDLDRQRSQLQSQLANQGVVQGSQAYETAMDQFGRQVNDANTQALLAGNQEQNVLFGQSATQGQFANAAQQQQYGQNQGIATFQNQAQAQSNAENAALAGFQNAAQGQQYGENAASAAFGNQAQAQQNSQNAALAAFGNTAQAQTFQQNAAQLAAQNAAQDQLFNQNAQQGAFANTAQQQAFGEGTTNAQLNNAATAQGFSQNQAAANFQNQANLQQMQAQMAMREAPLNEVSALMHGGQVTAPQFSAYNPGNIQAAPVAQSAYQSAGLLNQQYTTQLQAQGAQNAGLFGLLGSAAGAAGSYFGSPAGGSAPSDRRLKRDIVETGTIGRFKAYAFRYLWSDQLHIGVMADEVLPIIPEAVHVNDNGFMSVDYSKLAA